MKRLSLLLIIIGIGFTTKSGVAATASASVSYTFTGVRKQILLTFTQASPSPTFKLDAVPKNGKVEYYDTATSSYKLLSVGVPMSTKIWYYTSNSGFVGTDTFQWSGTDAVGTDSAKCTIIMRADLYGKNWPQYRYDENRECATAMQLADTLHLQWTWQFPASQTAWKHFQFQFDAGYEPVVVGKTLFVGFNGSDKLLAFDTDTGAEKWRFYTGGPVRFAPVVTGGKVFIGSDDGYLYCVDAASGSELWKFRGGPSEPQVFGNRRMTSRWPIRGGPVLSRDGMVYFACGLVPSEGIFIYRVNPATGAIVWMNDMSGTMTVDQPHATVAVTGLSPQGYLVINRDNTRVMVPSGHAMPGYFDLLTGKMDEPWYQGGTRDKNGAAWYVNADGLCNPPLAKVLVGSKEYTTGPGVTEPVYTLIAADDKLFVVTKTGKIYCFGATPISTPPARSFPTVALPVVSDHWKTEVSTMLGGLDNSEGSCIVVGIGSGRLVEELAKQSKFQIDVFDSDPAKVNGLRRKLDNAKLYGGRTAAWSPTTIKFNPDKTWFGVPGTFSDDTAKVAVHLMSSSQYEFPPYSAKLVVSEDIAEAGFAAGTGFVKCLFNGLRPYGGNIWLYTSSAEHTLFQGWVSSLSLPGITVSRNGTYSVLQRNGRIPGATDFVKPASGKPMSPDEVAKAPFGTLWWDDGILSSYVDQSDIINGLMIDQGGVCYDLYNGLPTSRVTTWSGIKELSPKSPSTGPESMRVNPLINTPESRSIWQAYGCRAGESYYGKLMTYRSGTMAYYDPSRESGSINLGGMKPLCWNKGMIPANGVLLLGSYYCGCEYPLNSVILAMVHRPDAQELGVWGFNRTVNPVEDQPIRKVGLNFGAVGDRHENGLLWLHRPYSTKPTPDIPVFITPEASVEKYSHHTSWLQGAASLPWVANTGLKGMNQISVNLAYPTVLSLNAVTPPTLDGSLSDSCWNGAGKLSLYHMNYCLGKPLYKNPILGGEVQIRHDASKLYVACRYLSGDVANIYKEAGWDIWLSDRVKLGSKSIHLRVDRDNVKYDALSLKSSEDSTWTGVWSNGFRKTPTEFIVEFSVPWSTLTAEGYDKNSLVMNIQGPGLVEDSADILRLRNLKDYRGGADSGWTTKGRDSCELFSAVSFDSIAGDLGKNRTYTVRMHFTEPDDLAVGKRKFDVAIQGATKLTDFDIVAAAGGGRKPIVKEFTGIIVKDTLTVNFTPKVGVPVISGIEILETGGGGPVDTTAPTVPTGLTASAVSSSQINLSWTASTDVGGSGVAGYKIYRGGTLVGTASGTTYSDTGLTASTAYSYKVAAYDASGNTSAQSSGASATTSAAAGDTTPPTVPTGLTASAASSSQINLSWTASTDAFGVTGYKIYRGITQVGTSTTTTYSDTGLIASTSYTYKVAAYDAAGNVSAQSSAASATTLAASGGGDSDADGLPDSWEIVHFGSITDSRAVPTADPDGDGFTNEHEYKAGTSPVASADRLAVTDETFPSSTSFKITWQSVAGKSYEVQSSSDMVTWTTVTTAVATSTSTTWTNSGLSGVEKKFYRVRMP